MFPPVACPGARNKPIKLLAAFLDAETIRVMPSAATAARPRRNQFDPDAPVGLFHDPQFAVGNFAASKLPQLLEIIGEPREDFATEDWTRSRERVRPRSKTAPIWVYQPDKD